MPKAEYPKSIPSVNDADHEIFDGMDFSELFMTPEELRIKRWNSEKDAVRGMV